jgi:hypothetical protein
MKETFLFKCIKSYVLPFRNILNISYDVNVAIVVVCQGKSLVVMTCAFSGGFTVGPALGGEFQIRAIP